MSFCGRQATRLQVDVAVTLLTLVLWRRLVRSSVGTSAILNEDFRVF